MIDRPKHPDDLSEQVAKKEQRKLKARRERHSIWYGLGMFGLVGWSIAIPTVIGIAIGVWIDKTWPSRYSCTLMCLFLGVVLGCWIAWHWVKQESQAERSPGDDTSDNNTQGSKA